MDVVIQAAVIAAGVSIIAIFISRVFEIMENKKSRYVSIITKQTLSNMLYVRKNISKILSLTHPVMLYELNNYNISDVKKELIISCTNIEAQFKSVIPMEVELINATRDLIVTFLAFCGSSNHELCISIAEKHAKVTELFAPYDYADWLYCKEQAWNKKKTFSDFESIYKRERVIFDNSVKPINWISLLKLR